MSERRLTLSVEEAARYAGVGRDRMYAAVQAGELPSVRVSYNGRTRRLLPADVRTWIRAQRREGTTAQPVDTKPPIVSAWDDLPELLSPKEAASVLGMSADMVRERCRLGQLPHRKLGARIVLSKRRLREWMDGDDATPASQSSD